MSEACTHDCGNCSSDCGERTAPQSLNNANNKGVKKVIAVVSGKGGVGKSLVTSMLAVSAAKKGLKTAILDADITGPSIPMAFGVAHEKGVYHAGKPVAKSGVEVVGGIVVHPGIQPQNGFALAAGSVLGKDHHFAGQPLARPGGIDGQGVDDGHLVVIGRGGPAAVLVFRQLISVEVHAAPDGAVLVHAYIQGPGVEDIPGGVGGGVSAPLPACVMQAGGVLMV